MSARGYALHSVVPNFPFLFSTDVELEKIHFAIVIVYFVWITLYFVQILSYNGKLTYTVQYQLMDPRRSAYTQHPSKQKTLTVPLIRLVGNKRIYLDYFKPYIPKPGINNTVSVLLKEVGSLLHY